jgi:hypothetical protein
VAERVIDALLVTEVVSLLGAELAADLRQQLRTHHGHRLLGNLHALRRLAQIQIVRHGLGNDGIKLWIIE